MIALLVSVFVASVLGSVHCGAMCGGFVCAVSAGERPFASQLAWHAGRGFAYVLLGLGAGALGQGLEHTLAPTGLAHLAAVVAGTLLMVWGGLALMAELGVRQERARPSPIAGPLGVALRAVRGWPWPARGTAMGALTALLPCGWLWGFVATAGGTGRPLAGALVMLVFWSGTLPLLVAFGVAAGRVLAPLQRRLPILTASAMIVLGLFTVAGRFRPHDPSHAGPHVGSHTGSPGGGHPAAPDAHAGHEHGSAGHVAR